jgi:hypothetical protein
MAKDQSFKVDTPVDYHSFSPPPLWLYLSLPFLQSFHISFISLFIVFAFVLLLAHTRARLPNYTPAALPRLSSYLDFLLPRRRPSSTSPHRRSATTSTRAFTLLFSRPRHGELPSVFLPPTPLPLLFLPTVASNDSRKTVKSRGSRGISTTINCCHIVMKLLVAWRAYQISTAWQKSRKALRHIYSWIIGAFPVFLNVSFA